GVRFGVDGDGMGSGFGPVVTFFHKNLLGRGIDVEVPLNYTYKRYQVYEFNASIPLSTAKRLDRFSFDLRTGYNSRAQDDFFGIGNDSPVQDERQYRMVTRRVSAGLSAKLNDRWKSSARAEYRNVGITKPTSGSSAQDFFNSNSVPGLSGATLGSAIFSIERDSRVYDNRTFKGGLDQFEVSFNRSTDGG